MKEKLLRMLFFGVVFIFFFVFFAVIHPLVIYDADDWHNIGFIRDAIPIWKAWNPTKVLPETLMGICGYIGAYCITPLLNDYLTSLTYAMALMLSLFIVVFIYTSDCFFRKQLSLSKSESIMISVLFLCLHFLPFKVFGTNNIYHYFYAGSATLYFHYLLPAWLSAIVLLLLLNGASTDLFRSSASFVLLAYLAVLSNLYQSIILITGVVVLIMMDLWRSRNKNGAFFTSSFFRKLQ